MNVVKIVLTSVKLALLIAIIVALFQIKCELSGIKAVMETKNNAVAMKEMNWQAKKEKFGGDDWKAKKEKMGKDWGNWTATKELCEQKLDKIQEFLQTKEGAEKSEFATRYKQLRAAVEKEDSDFTDLFKDIKVLIKELKVY